MHYSQSYFKGGKESSYMDYQTCKGIVRNLAEIIFQGVKKFNNYTPNTMLDVGCAYGFITEYFQGKGVNSYGVDISEWAVSQAPKLVQGKIFVDMLPNLENISNLSTKHSLPKTFDLITSVEVLEHIPVHEIELSLKRLYELTGKYLIIMPAMSVEGSYLEADPNDITHISMLPRSWWVKTIQELGFKRNSFLEHNLNSHPTAMAMKWGKCPEVPEGRMFVLEKL